MGDNVGLKRKPIPDIGIMDFIEYLESTGVVGETRNSLVVLSAIINKKTNVLIESSSGGGKTSIMTPIFDLLPDGYVKRLEIGSKKNAVYEDFENTGCYYVPELQNAGQSETAVAIFKKLGESDQTCNEVTYNVTVRNPSGSIPPFITHTVKIPKRNFITTFAIQNRSNVLDKELERRMLKLTTDISTEQNRRVVESGMARHRDPLLYHEMNHYNATDLQTHISNCLSLKNVDVINPGIDAMSDRFDCTFLIIRSIKDYFAEIIKGITLFNYPNRAHIESNGKTYYISTPEDNYITYSILWDTFNEQSLMLPPLGLRILKVFETIDTATHDTMLKKRGQTSLDMVENDTIDLTIYEIQELMRKSGYPLDLTVLEKAIEQLRTAGYIRYKDNSTGRGAKYILGDIPKLSQKIDWKKLFKQCDKYVYDTYPDIYESYQKTVTKRVFDVNKQEYIDIINEKPQENDEKEESLEDTIKSIFRQNHKEKGIRWKEIQKEIHSHHKNAFSDDDIDNVLKTMLRDGEIYEPKIGLFRHVQLKEEQVV